ncbi:chloride channel protein [Methylovirgula sp. 4M-Z18]|uniref:chloride channel protein n=1 Tax=Methylovirgula sp. 4M-Z18 TaxID=2293567 RepID=UPI000E2ED0E2|nr:chloride channel protein [Methylovirgula sp. 4M-Z18]RFB80900.1 chloride channel protein [Methylovirgula sp. 4M-Z18]
MPLKALPRLLRIHSARFQRRAVFLIGGVVVGGGAAAMALLADAAQSEFRKTLQLSPYLPLVLTPLGFALSVYLTRRFFPNSQGSGIPQVIAAREFDDQADRQKLVSLKIAFGKILLTLLGLLCGGSVGREGPTVQVGASVMFEAGRLSPRRQRGWILAGASAGVAAAFNTPLAGIVFGIEEMSQSFELRTSGLILGTVIAAGVTSQALLGDYTYFGTTGAVLHGWRDWACVPMCGILGGLAGGLFSRLLIAMARGLPGQLGALIKANPIAFAAACGFLVGLCGVASNGVTYGTGYQEVTALLHQHGGPGQGFGVFKFIATALSAISGIPGGIFSPSLAVGAGLGANVAAFLPGATLEAVIVLGMVSYFTGVVQAPITAFVIVTEMTGNHAMIMPIMAAAFIAHWTSKLICPQGIYHALARNFLSLGAARGSH